MNTPMTDRFISDDLWDPATFAAGIPYASFAVLREQAPVSFHQERPRRSGGKPGPGFWCVTRHADIHEVSRSPEIYSSWLGGFTGADISGAVLEETRLNMMAMDPPDHTAFRSAIREPFGPRVARTLGPVVEGFATAVVDAVIDDVTMDSQSGASEPFDFVEHIAAELPLLTLAHLLGVAAEDRGLFYDWSNRIIGNHDPDFGGSVADFLAAKDELFAYGRRVIEEKRQAPDDGLVSSVLDAKLDGEPIDEEKVVILWFLLLIAGNETTRSSLTGAMEMLSAHPDQRELLMSDLDAHLPGFVEETLRFTNPVLHFRRTATRDVRLGDAEISKGDKVLLWYPSANRDEAVFEDPDRFDLTRSPNHHQAFGIGPHFCLGARIGRMQIQTMLRELLTRLPTIDVVGPGTRIHSNFLSGAKSLPVAVR